MKPLVVERTPNAPPSKVWQAFILLNDIWWFLAEALKNYLGR